MAYRVGWTESAWQELEAAAQYIAQDSSYFASALIYEARIAAQSLRKSPKRGRVVPELRDTSVREIFVKQYRLIYEVGSDRVIIFVFSSRRAAVSGDDMKGLALLLPLLLASCGRREAVPDLAVYTGQGFQLVNIESKSTRSIPCSIPVGSFSVAPNGRFLVFASKEGRARMGQIYRLDFGSQRILKLTSEPFYFTPKRFPPLQTEFSLPERELYSDVEVSPDSRFAAFAVHSVADNDSDDLIGLAGPLAVMDLSSAKARILSSTEKVDGEGPAYANTPRWSQNGRDLLMAFEISGAITSVRGDTLQLLDPQLSKPFEEGTVSPRAWLSESEVLFVWNPRPVSGIGKLFRLNLTTGQVSSAASFLPIAESTSYDVLDVDVNSRYILIQHQGRSELFRRTGELLQTWNAGARLRLFN